VKRLGQKLIYLSAFLFLGGAVGSKSETKRSAGAIEPLERAGPVPSHESQLFAGTESRLAQTSDGITRLVVPSA
jgi:hypothetical protein